MRPENPPDQVQASVTTPSRERSVTLPSMALLPETSRPLMMCTAVAEVVSGRLTVPVNVVVEGPGPGLNVVPQIVTEKPVSFA